MVKKLLIIALPLLLGFGIALTQDKTPPPEQRVYAGLNRCKMCHKGEKNGNIFEIWESSPHAKAYATLASDKSKEVYKKLGKTGDPQKDSACLKCHITGAGLDAKYTAALKVEEGVTCESCHSAGNDYWKKSIMENREEAIKNGLNPEPQKSCVACHNAESPTYKEFKYDEFWKQIAHKVPPK